MADEITNEQAEALFEIDLEMMDAITDMQEQYPEREDVDLIVQYMRWAFILGYCCLYEQLDTVARLAVKDPSAWPVKG